MGLAVPRIFAEQGALLTYGPSADTARRVAYYIDRILKSAMPSNLSAEQLTQFELVINLETVKQTIPPFVLARAVG